MKSKTVAMAIAQEAKRIRKKYPDLEEFISTGYENGRLLVRKSNWPEGVTIGVPVTRAGHTEAAGANVTVGFDRGNRQRPFVKSIQGRARGVAASSGGGSSLILAPWCQSEGNPYCNRGPVSTNAPPDWAGSASTIGSMPRYYYDDALQSAPESGSPDLTLMLSFEGVVITDTRVAAMACLYNGDASAIIGYLVREWDPSDSSQTGEWIHLSGSTVGTAAVVGLQRRNGYLFYDEASDTYTVAAHDGLVLCTRDNEPTPTVCTWANSYGSIPEHSAVSVAGGYALQGALHSCDLAFDSASLHAVDCYQRGESAWEHVAQVVLGDKLSNVDLYRPVGQWDPFSEDESPTNPENSRWPYLPSTNEWIVWISGKGGEDSFGFPAHVKRKLIGIKASTGAVRTIHEASNPAPFLWTPKDAATLQAEIEADFEYRNDPHPEDWIAIGGGEFQDLYGRQILHGVYSVNPDDPLDIYADAGYEFEVPWVDRPPSGYGKSYAIDINYYDDNWSTNLDPTIPPDSYAISADEPFYANMDIPQTIVDGSKIYLVERESGWLADLTTAANLTTRVYGGYVDYPAGSAINGSVLAADTRIYKFVSNFVDVGFNYRANAVRRTTIKSFTSSTLSGTLDLTRSFTDLDGFITRREPDIWAFGAAGGYLWLLASDWSDADTQALALILVNATSMVELDRLWLEPDTGLSWHAVSGRPQLVVGSDGTGPWAQVTAWWTDGTPRWIVQDVRYESSALSATTVIDSTSPSNLPGDYTESVNQALQAGTQYWLDSGTDLIRRA